MVEYEPGFKLKRAPHSSPTLVCYEYSADIELFYNWANAVKSSYNLKTYKMLSHAEYTSEYVPDSKVHGANMGPPGSCLPQVGPMNLAVRGASKVHYIQYIPRNRHTVFALLCFVVVIHWLIFPYPSGLLHWHCGNLTIAPVPAKQPWWIWINTSCEFIMNDCITTTKQSTTKPCAYFLGYTVPHPHRLTIQCLVWVVRRNMIVL